jgi:hypothetical protein
MKTIEEQIELFHAFVEKHKAAFRDEAEAMPILLAAYLMGLNRGGEIAARVIRASSVPTNPLFPFS